MPRGAHRGGWHFFKKEVPVKGFFNFLEDIRNFFNFTSHIFISIEIYIYEPYFDYTGTYLIFWPEASKLQYFSGPDAYALLESVEIWGLYI